MKIFLDPDKTLSYKALVLIMSLSVLAGLMITPLHFFIDPNPSPFSLLVPPIITTIFFALLIQLLRKPESALLVFQIGFLTLWTANLVPAWFFPLEAAYRPNIQLIDTLPPIASVLFVLTFGMVIFVHPDKVVKVAFAAWISIASPSLLYLITHPTELETSRGLDLFISLGPAMTVNMAMIFFYSCLQHRLQELKIERSQFKNLSERDHLTGIYNRAAGEKILQSLLISPQKQAGLILFDIDCFKAINDTYGHAVGDQVLQELSQRCLSRLRSEDVLIRWGGEEFLVIVNGVSVDEAYFVAEQLRGMIAQHPIEAVGTVTASFGTTGLRLGDSVEGILHRADTALYAAKQAGRNRVILDGTYSFKASA
ncbi:MAG: GGDEF domain-containing protein [Cyanobacteria bacterium P01_A01_bin.123]